MRKPSAKCGTQFVSQSQWREDLAVALALLQLPLGGLHQVHYRCVRSYQPRKFVHVVLEEFILHEPGIGRQDQFVNHCPREEQRGRISGAEKGHVDGNDGFEPLHHFAVERAGVQSGMREPDQLLPDSFCSWVLHAYFHSTCLR